jgi:myosin-15
VQVDLVKFSSVPIEQSLLRLEPGELSELAVECFAAVMRYMGDLSMAPDSTEVKCVYTILMVSILYGILISNINQQEHLLIYEVP